MNKIVKRILSVILGYMIINSIMKNCKLDMIEI